MPPVAVQVSAESFQRKVQTIEPGTRDVKIVMQPKIPGTPG
jgi:hypothetical protein